MKHLPGCLIYVGCTCFDHACENEDCKECELKAELNRQIDRGEKCEHWDVDDHMCLDCGKDLTADRMAVVIDRAKDARKHGEV